MNKDVKEHINTIMVSYLDAISDGIEDMSDAYRENQTSYFNAVSRHKTLAEAVSTAMAGIEQMIAVGEMLKRAD